MISREVSGEGRLGVLMATYRGERFINAQLQSLANQDWPTIDVVVSDDGSKDGTLGILRRWQCSWSKGTFSIRTGPQAGFVENFRSLMAEPGIETDFVAFADQDDLWDGDKVSAAISALRKAPSDTPALYCSRTRIVDEGGRELGLSPLFARPASFRNAIVQNLGGGNTMVMNRAASDLLSESARRTSFVTHDWWSYILISGVGGSVIYDPVPRIGYRQHSGNLIGDNMSLAARLLRIRLLLQGRFAAWNAVNLAALGKCEDLLTEEVKDIVRTFARLRQGSFLDRVRALRDLGLYRQSVLSTLALYLAAAMGRI